MRFLRRSAPEASIPTPEETRPAISPWIRFSPEVVVSLVAKDASGRTPQFRIRATIEHSRAGDWQYVDVPLSAKRARNVANDANRRNRRPAGGDRHPRSGSKRRDSAVDPSLAARLTAIGIHPYRETGPETIAPELVRLRDWVTRTFGAHIEIWDSEWGYTSASVVKGARSEGHAKAASSRQAVLAVREVLTTWAVGLPLAVWYDLRDDGPDATNPEQNYGLLDANDNEKPAMTAIRTLTGILSGRKYAGMIAETPSGIHAMRLDGSADTILILWTDGSGGRRTVEYPKRDLISASDLMGRA